MENRKVKLTWQSRTKHFTLASNVFKKVTDYFVDVKYRQNIECLFILL